MDWLNLVSFLSSLMIRFSTCKGGDVLLATLLFTIESKISDFGLEFLWDPGKEVVGRNGDRIIPASVPEPATLLLLGVGLAGVAGFGRKKFNRKTQ